MRLIRTALAGILALFAVAVASAQQFPVVPDHSVIGRIGTGGQSGPSQAIPFPNLKKALGISTTSEVYASDFGVVCDGVTPASAAMQLAVNTASANGTWPVIMPSGGVCVWDKNVFLNRWAGASVLSVPSFKIRAHGSTIDTRVANGYALSVNPDWRAAHKAIAGITAGSSGSLAANTYFVQITETDPLGNEIFITLPKSLAVGSTGSISVILPALNTGYSYNIYASLSATPANYATVAGANAVNLAGNQTVTITAIGGAHAVPTDKRAVWQEADIADLWITNTTAAANASGILYFKVAYAGLTNVHMTGLTGDGLDVPNYSGDSDGSIGVAIKNSKFDTIAGWCVNATGMFLENSNFTVDSLSVFNVCGTLPSNLNTNVTILSINNSASPTVTTSTAHNWLANDQIYIQNVAGMSLPTGWYRVGSTVGGSTFNLVDLNGVAVNTTALGAYTASSGTGSLSWRPPTLTTGSGCLAWMGLIGTVRNTNFTQCNNVAIYASEGGTSDNLTIENVDVENTAGKGLYVGSLAGGAWNQGECLSAVGLGSTISCVQIGSGYAAGGVQNFKVANIKVRNNVTPAAGFEQFQNTSIGATYSDTNRVGGVTWQTFDAAGQTRFNGFVFDPIPGQVKFQISGVNTAQLIPIGFGGCLPLHLASPGEWVCAHLPTTGVSNAIGALSATTVYNCYAYNSAAVAFPVAVAIECNATATAMNEGYQVKSGDATRTFIGTAKTDGGGNFQTAGLQTSWYGGAGAVTGAVKGNGAGGQSQAACADVSNALAGCSEANAIKSDMQTPSSSALLVTPAQVQNHPGVAKFFARMDGKTGATCTLKDSYNIASCVRNSAGNYTLTFTTAFADANYAVVGSGFQTGVASAVVSNTTAANFATGTYAFTCLNSTTSAAMDCDIMNVAGFGPQ